MKIFFSWMMLLITIIMYFMNHPLSMGILILVQTLLVCLMSGLLINTYWFSYILFLTFLGGLLVLFIYVSSIASNEMFSKYYNFYYVLIYSLMMLILIMLMFYKNLSWLNLIIGKNEMEEMFNNFMFLNNENKINLSKLYNNQTYIFMMMMIIYLFITLVAVVKITNIFYGPLRSNFY